MTRDCFAVRSVAGRNDPGPFCRFVYFYVGNREEEDLAPRFVRPGALGGCLRPSASRIGAVSLFSRPSLFTPRPPLPANVCRRVAASEDSLVCTLSSFPFSRWVLWVRSRRDLRGAKGELPHFRGGEDRLRILKLAGISISPRAHSGGTSPASSSSPANRSRSCGYAS